MKIAILTEGKSEFKSLPLLYEQLHQKMPVRTQLLRPLKINATPDAPPLQIVAACRAPLAIAARDADKAIILLDRETQDDCPGQIASALETGLARITNIRVHVALKDRKYENWLISDLDALRAYPARFKVDQPITKRVVPDKADKIDAESEIERMVIRAHYDKIRDSDRICRAASIDSMAANSRSFRHFLHLLRYDPYREQCARPAGRSQITRADGEPLKRTACITAG
ncbi:DUF4276 family protein [Mycobacterium paraterrae]|uniref:DUF4276 family protein n=1 Tax=Mycobacterium paraterrae TaxID=577492 RepID=A0ABY3VV55_9MYCO|nr:DUF4276 family protein [Mycobacterium paraterrae]UMB71420.1 DUF4276 family protein [Mycobacterium paraterrae]